MTTLALIITIVLAAFVWAFWVLRPRSRTRTHVRTKKKQTRQMSVPYYY